MRASLPMTRDVICASPEQSLESAWQIMSAKRIRHLPVVRAGALLGTLSDRDILLHAKVGEAGLVRVPGGLLVDDAMTRTPLETCEPTDSVSSLVRRMLEDKIDAILVVRGLRLLGLVTSSDLMSLILERDDDDARALPFNFRLIEDARAYA